MRRSRMFSAGFPCTLLAACLAAALMAGSAVAAEVRANGPTPALSGDRWGVIALASATVGLEGVQSVAARVRVRAAGRRARPVRRPIARPGIRPGLRPGVIVNRPTVVVRPWRPRPHYGRIIAGVALGTVIVAAIAGSVPAQPAPNVCWYWADPAQTQGYWDYCR
jgi:hypothetical protein